MRFNLKKLIFLAAWTILAEGIAYPQDPDKLQALVGTSARRLAIAEQVALAKWDNGVPVEDASREDQVIVSAAKAGQSRGLDPTSVSNFFRAQFEANKLSAWEGDSEPGKYIGRIHLVHEYLGAHLAKLKINFRDPGEILDKSRFAEAKVGTAIYGYVGAIGESGWFGRLLHLVQETPEGCVMRSRFWLGEIEPVPNPKPTPEMLQKKAPDELGAGLYAHCCEEMSILAGFLPTLYRIHNADTRRPLF